MASNWIAPQSRIASSTLKRGGLVLEAQGSTLKFYHEHQFKVGDENIGTRQVSLSLDLDKGLVSGTETIIENKIGRAPVTQNLPVHDISIASEGSNNIRLPISTASVVGYLKSSIAWLVDSWDRQRFLSNIGSCNLALSGLDSAEDVFSALAEVDQSIKG